MMILDKGLLFGPPCTNTFATEMGQLKM